MVNRLFGAAAALALAFAPAVHAQQTPAAPAPAPTTQIAKPALWVVKDRDTTIYLFGTVHVLKPGVQWFGGGVKAAFDKSDQVMLEMVEPDPATMQGLVVKLAFNPTSPGVTQQLPEGKRSAYVAAMTGLGIPAAQFDKFDPWFPAVVLSVASLPKYGYDPNSGAEKVITAAAKQVGKPVAGLETAEQQLGYFDNLPLDTQLKFLALTVDQLPDLAVTLGKMIERWSAGDPDGLAALLNEDLDASPDIRRILLTERNQRWADWIQKRLAQPGTVFIAVGAGHLAGGESVQSFLAAHHVKAKRVAY